MVSLEVVKYGYTPINNRVAKKIIGPNYDEFQNNVEIFNILKKNRENILSITMPHCDVEDVKLIMKDGSQEALNHGLENFNRLINSNKVKEIKNFLWVYEIQSSRDPSFFQIGIGGMAKTSEIRYEKNPSGTILRNEEVYEEKVEGRAKIIKKFGAFLGIVNCAVEDKSNSLLTELNSYKLSRKPDLTVPDEQKNIHRLWFVFEKKQIEKFVEILRNEEYAYVADGNHRSLAALSLGYNNFLAVFFPVSRMRILSYNRLVKPDFEVSIDEISNKLKDYFLINKLNKKPKSVPSEIHNFYLYTRSQWFHLICKMENIKPLTLRDEIDSEIIHKFIFEKIFKISNRKDPRINYVGGNRDIKFLTKRVDNGEYKYAFLLAPVEMRQFIEISRKNLFMPPKSTWFDPKIRIGLVIAKVQ